MTSKFERFLCVLLGGHKWLTILETHNMRITSVHDMKAEIDKLKAGSIAVCKRCKWEKTNG